jgi:hypothetical protein
MMMQSNIDAPTICRPVSGVVCDNPFDSTSQAFVETSATALCGSTDPFEGTLQLESLASKIAMSGKPKNSV